MLDLLFWMQLLGILGEVLIAGLGVGIAFRSKSSVGWFMGLSFLLYALYDFIQLGRAIGSWAIDLSPYIIGIVYFIAVITMVISAWKIYKALD
ncbi:Uncharacterised protein [uncultured archaeon]|nr:Uncharacterised protein [uncultured archaeon]